MNFICGRMVLPTLWSLLVLYLRKWQSLTILPFLPKDRILYLIGGDPDAVHEESDHDKN